MNTLLKDSTVLVSVYPHQWDDWTSSGVEKRRPKFVSLNSVTLFSEMAVILKL